MSFISGVLLVEIERLKMGYQMEKRVEEKGERKDGGVWSPKYKEKKHCEWTTHTDISVTIGEGSGGGRGE